MQDKCHRDNKEVRLSHCSNLWRQLEISRKPMSSPDRSTKGYEKPMNDPERSKKDYEKSYAKPMRICIEIYNNEIDIS